MTAAKLRHKKREADKRRKTSSLFRKLSNKRASAERAGMLSASSSLQSLKVSCDWWIVVVNNDL